MHSDEKIKEMLSKLEILIAALLFVTMLLSCGLYIDIKMNGKTSSLPELSDADKKLLLRTVASEDVTYNDDLVEPVFVGVKNETAMVAACPDDAARKSVENTVYNSLYLLFSGTSEEIKFKSDDERNEYIEELKASESYMLLGFYSELPSSAILPCLSKNYDIGGLHELFFVKYLFLMPDDNGSLYGVSVSEEGFVNKLYPSESIAFNKIFSESYDVNNGYSYFEYDDSALLRPVLSSSFMANKYKVSNFAEEFGKDKNSEWVSNLFDIFSINSSLVKEYPSNNNTQINYIDDTREITINDDGFVEFTSHDGGGIYLDEYLGYAPGANSGYTFNDKIFALKSIVNKLMENNDSSHSYSIVGVDYDKASGDFTVYLKSFTGGILVTDKSYDAMFEIKNDFLTYASFYAVRNEKLDNYSIIIPQKYANLISESTPDNGVSSDMSMICPMLSPENDGSDIYVLKWAMVESDTEVAE